MLDEHNQHITEAKPSTPVKIIGWKTLPAAGDLVLQVDNEVKTWQDFVEFSFFRTLLKNA